MLLDLVVPTVALVMTVGEESKPLLDSILKDAKFLLTTAARRSGC